MKKIVLLVVCVAMSAGAFAQDWNWGVKGGLNLSSLSNSGDNSKMKASIFVGAFGEYKFNDIFGIQPEIQYSRQGNFYKEDGEKVWYRMNYINVPVLAKIYVLDKLSVDLGPQVGFLLNSKAKAKVDGTTVKSDIDGLRSVDFTIAMGLTYNLMSRIDVSARYNLGLTDVIKGNEGDKVRNGALQIGVGYRF